MGLGWADWIRFVLTPIVLGLIAAIVATRNAKKTPHERLKNLVDIHDKMPEDLDSNKVVEAAIARELVDFDRRVAADQRGLWAAVRERFAQLGTTMETSGVAAITPLAVGLVIAVAVKDEDPALALAIPVTVFFVIAAGVLYLRFSSVRQSLNLDRAVAYMTATLPRTSLQFLASRDFFHFRSSREDVRGVLGDSAFARLRSMGVFERKRTDGGIGVTSFGREAIRRSLSEADRQYLAHLANVKTEMEARDDVSAREAREEGGAAQPLG